ncbi:MAG: DNA-3-methyladenine glycosylase [Patescibacteria group bacterium]
MIGRLKRKFFTRPTLIVAKDLLGKILIRKYRKKIIAGKIVETEAYIGPQDRASHGYKMKKTLRNRAEYLVGGHIYIYLVYGMYYQLNISTEKEGLPRCVLIRALEPISFKIKKNKYNKLKFQLANGPGKLCRYLKLDKSFYGEDLVKSKRIWLEDRGIKIKKSEIVASKRIGIDYAGKYWANKKWRFYLKNNPCVSKK